MRLRPAPHCRTPVLSYSLKVTPEKHFINWQQDPHGNFLARLVFPEKTRELSVMVDLVAEMTVINPFAFFLQDEAIEYPFRYEDAVRTDLLPYLETLPRTAAAEGVPGRHSPQEQEDGRFPRRSESVRPQGGEVRDPHGDHLTPLSVTNDSLSKIERSFPIVHSL